MCVSPGEKPQAATWPFAGSSLESWFRWPCRTPRRHPVVLPTCNHRPSIWTNIKRPRSSLRDTLPIRTGGIPTRDSGTGMHADCRTARIAGVRKCLAATSGAHCLIGRKYYSLPPARFAAVRQECFTADRVHGPEYYARMCLCFTVAHHPPCGKRRRRWSAANRVQSTFGLHVNAAGTLAFQAGWFIYDRACPGP